MQKGRVRKRKRWIIYMKFSELEGKIKVLGRGEFTSDGLECDLSAAGHPDDREQRMIAEHIISEIKKIL